VKNICFAVLLALGGLVSTSAGQTAEGVQEGETMYKEVSVQNLNLHWDIPIVDKAGIGLPFKYALHY